MVGSANTVNSFIMRLPDPLEHGGDTWQHDVDAQAHADVNVTYRVFRPKSKE